MNILEIIDAWCTSFYPSKEEIAIAVFRSEICDKCEYKVKLDSSLLSAFTANDKILYGYKCGACECPLSKKLFSYFKTACPKNKWDM